MVLESRSSVCKLVVIQPLLLLKEFVWHSCTNCVPIMFNSSFVNLEPILYSSHSFSDFMISLGTDVYNPLLIAIVLAPLLS